jgi:hypothetical protein
VVLDGLVAPLKIAVAQRFGDAVMLVHDRRHAPPIASHRFAGHPHLTVAQRRVEIGQNAIARFIKRDLVKGAVGVQEVLPVGFGGGLMGVALAIERIWSFS